MVQMSMLAWLCCQQDGLQGKDSSMLRLWQQQLLLNQVQ
jgi:hypothetical protein